MINYYKKFLLLVLCIIGISSNSYANLWEGKVNGKSIIITYKGIIQDGKLRKTYVLGKRDLCVYGNTNFPNSPPNYNIVNAFFGSSWGGSWRKEFMLSSNTELIKECNQQWKKFISSANILEKEVSKSENKNPRHAADLYFLPQNIICNKASEGNLDYVLEAKSRGLNECFKPEDLIRANIKKENERRLKKQKKDSVTKQLDKEICRQAVINGRWDTRPNFLLFVEEAKQRGLDCGIKDDKEEKKRTAREKAEQEKIKKKAEEAERKKKIEEEKRRKKQLAEEKARKKKQAEKERKRKLAQKKLNKQITNYKREAKNFYNDVTEFVKSGGEIDVIKLTDLFSKRPKTNEQWTQKHIKDYEELQLLMYQNEAFISFEKTLKEMRIAKANADKSNTIKSLNENSKKLKTILRKNFGNDEIVTKINYNIKLISNVLNKKFNQIESDKALESTSKFLSYYFAKEKTSKVIDDKLGNKRVQLSEILTKEFGSERAQEASRFIKKIDVASSISDKKFILEELKVFLESPEKKRARKEKLANELEKERKRKQKRKLAEAKEREKKRLLGPCSEISGGWGKTKCVAFLKTLPLRFVCKGMFNDPKYDGYLEVDINSYDDITFKSNKYKYGKVIKDKLLTNGILSIVDEGKDAVFNSYYNITVKIKISLLFIEYEQLGTYKILGTKGDFEGSGYCQKRL